MDATTRDLLDATVRDLLSSVSVQGADHGRVGAALRAGGLPDQLSLISISLKLSTTQCNRNKFLGYISYNNTAYVYTCTCTYAVLHVHMLYYTYICCITCTCTCTCNTAYVHVHVHVHVHNFWGKICTF